MTGEDHLAPFGLEGAWSRLQMREGHRLPLSPFGNLYPSRFESFALATYVRISAAEERPSFCSPRARSGSRSPSCLGARPIGLACPIRPAGPAHPAPLSRDAACGLQCPQEPASLLSPQVSSDPSGLEGLVLSGSQQCFNRAGGNPVSSRAGSEQAPVQEVRGSPLRAGLFLPAHRAR
jgi:hypothetical protein